MASPDKTPQQYAARACQKHGEYVPDDTLLGCPECAAEALAKEKIERAVQRG